MAAVRGAEGTKRKESFMTKLSVIAALAAGFLSSANAEPWTSRSFYNERGHFSGSAITRGNSTSTYDSSGRFSGSTIRNSNGTTSFYDRNGRFIGSSTNRTR